MSLAPILAQHRRGDSPCRRARRGQRGSTRALALVALAAIAAAGVGLWVLRSREPGASGDHVYPFREVAEAPCPLPGAAGRTAAGRGAAPAPVEVGPPFVDVTGTVLGAEPCFERQLLRGEEQWAGALDVALGGRDAGRRGLAVGDVDGDGLPDLFVAQAGGLPDRLLVQRADGTARDVAPAAGVDSLEPTAGALILDLDNDGDQDLVTAGAALVFLSNDGTGRFEVETVVPTSPVVSISAADYDADGDLDVYACKLSERGEGPPNFLLRNDGQWRFTDVTRESGLDENNRGRSVFAVWWDRDGDGDPDLYVHNESEDDVYYRNDGGTFAIEDGARPPDPFAGMGIGDDPGLPDDGRNLALVDWDLDGAPDLWIASRNGPQLRLLRNRGRRDAHFVALRLEGRGANRDAVGAQVELQRGDDAPLVRWIAAGGSLLSQSDKWVHFDLGDATQIERVRVTWPGGPTEEFAGLAADRHFRLVQGTGRAEPWDPPRQPVELPPSPRPAEPPPGAVRTYLAARLPLHGLESAAGLDARRTDGIADGPRLLVLWDEGCEPSRSWLTELAGAKSKLDGAGLGVVALGVDAPRDDPLNRPLLDALGWSWEHGYADAEQIDVLDVVRRWVVALPGEMRLPTSFLVDEAGRLAAIYRGPAEIDVLLADAGSLAAPAAERRERAVPFAGGWLRPAPERRDTRALAAALRERGHARVAEAYAGELPQPAVAPAPDAPPSAEALEYLGRSLASEQRHADAVAVYAKGLELDPSRISLQRAMGQSLLELHRLDGAVRHFQNTVRLAPNDGGAHFDLGTALAQSGSVDLAVAEFRHALALSREGQPAYLLALFNLGVASESQGRLDEALDYTRRVLEQQPDYFDGLRFLGHLHEQRREPRKAIEAYRQALVQQPDDARTLLQLGVSELAVGDRQAAQGRLERLQGIDPAAAARLQQALARSGR